MLKSGVVIAGTTLLATFLATCRASDAPPAVVTRRPKPAAVATLVLASADMSPLCRMSTAHAVRHLVELGAKLEMLTVDEDHPAIALEPRAGEITVRAGLPAGGALSESFAWRSPAGSVLRAEIVIGYCSTALIAHDLGHTLGMERQVDYERLLHAEGQDWGLDPMERP